MSEKINPNMDRVKEIYHELIKKEPYKTDVAQHGMFDFVFGYAYSLACREMKGEKIEW